LEANFGTGHFTGTLSPTYWEKFEQDTTIALDIVNNRISNGNEPIATADGKDVFEFHRAKLVLTGDINGNRVSGETYIISGNASVNSDVKPTEITNNDFVTGERSLQAGLYEEYAKQVTGVFATYGVLPDPNGGATGINDDTRRLIDIQGVFHGECITTTTCSQ